VSWISATSASTISCRICARLRDRGGNSPLSKWRVHLLKGLVRTAVSVHLQRFGE
jgi:hypothetical protein